MGCGKPCKCPSYAEHLRSITVDRRSDWDRKKERRWNQEMRSYEKALRYGLEPESVGSSPELLKRLGDSP